jgi:isopenicillin-N N-acyltransferase-like protein
VLEAAKRHLGALARHAPPLHDELRGIADAADLALEAMVVLNGHTDLVPAGPRPVDAGGGTAIYTVGRDGPLLGHTFDLHANAEPFVRMIRIAPPTGEGAVSCLTLTGCLGLAGLSDTGVAVTTSHLFTTDRQEGLIWPALVRHLLEAPDAEAALSRLRSVPRIVGRHCTIADGRAFFGIECSAELDVLTQTGPKAAHLHTNHCFDPVLRQRERVPASSTTFARLDSASTLYAQLRPAGLDELWSLLGNHDGRPHSICSHVDERDHDPHAPRTCARLVLQSGGTGLRVARGCSRTDDPLDIGESG